MADTDKNIYSLVLSDDVIDEIDSMARSAGLSRSAMVNQILAEKTRCITPEMRVKQITNAIREAVGGEFYLAQQPSPATVACRTALKYRYKPTLRYSVELFAVARKRTGELKVSVRSQSGQLNDDLTGFFQCWVKLEQKYLADKITHDLMFRIEPGKFVRTLNLPPKEVSDERLGLLPPGHSKRRKGGGALLRKTSAGAGVHHLKKGKTIIIRAGAGPSGRAPVQQTKEAFV